MPREVGLALSGGGFRAAFFHVGVLARLAELGILRKVEVISTVSGGSIVGAAYYAHVKALLETKADPTDGDYVDVVKHVEADLRSAVQKNVRARVYANLAKNAWMAMPWYSRSDRIGDLYDRYLYKPIWGERDRKALGMEKQIELRELLIQPEGEDAPFDPKVGNQTRDAKVPVLVINATTLNTGHNWRFEAVRMGEALPDDETQSALVEDVDKNMRLVRAYFECRTGRPQVPDKQRDFPLGLAVAASASVPGVFRPLSISGMYEGIRVQLVDGGVHDNQGVQALLDCNCNYLILSDASQHLLDEDRPSPRAPQVLFRSGSIARDRIRDLQVTDAGSHAAMALMHLRKGLVGRVVSPPDWRVTESEPPELTEFGVATKVQTALAAIRTDLDFFGDVEAFSLAQDGYLMTSHELTEAPAFADVRSENPLSAEWCFGAVAELIETPTDAYSRRLEAGRHRFLRLLRVWPLALRALIGLVVVLLLGLLVENAPALWEDVSSEVPVWVPAGALAAVALVVGGYALNGRAWYVRGPGAALMLVFVPFFAVPLFAWARLLLLAKPLYFLAGRVPGPGALGGARKAIADVRGKPRHWLTVFKAAAVFSILPLALVHPVVPAFLGVAILLLGWLPALTDLLVALRPLLLPALTAALFGAFGLDASQQVGLGVIAALVLIPWAASDWARTWRVVGGTIWHGSKAAMAVGMATVVGLLILLVALLAGASLEMMGGAVETFEEFGGFAISFAIFGAGLWLLAAVVRMAAYAWSAPRVLVALALVAAAWLFLVEGRLLPGDGLDWLSAGDLVLVAAALLVLTGVVEMLADAEHDSWARWDWIREKAARVAGRWPPRAQESVAAVGLTLSIASALVLAGALGFSAHQIDQEAKSVSGVRPGTPAIAGMSETELIEAFTPVLAFSHDQRWRPQLVDEYLREAEQRPADCPPGAKPPCYELVCPSADDACALDEKFSDRSADRLYRDGDAYVRLATVEEQVQPLDARVERVLQYWLFYPFDEWRAPVAGGRLVQRHAGDWEAVTIGLGATEPLFVALSQHCGGRWFEWEDAVVSSRLPERTHPLVAVAVGSHANYQRANEVRPADWSSCNGVRGEAVRLLTHSWNIRDRTDDDWELLPALTSVTAEDPPMNFQGRWGSEDVLEFKAFTTRTLHTGDGPASPPLQPLWTQPMARIFCGEAWRGPRDCPE